MMASKLEMYLKKKWTYKVKPVSDRVKEIKAKVKKEKNEKKEKKDKAK